MALTYQVNAVGKLDTTSSLNPKQNISMTSEKVSVLCGEEDEALEYDDDEYDLEAFSDADLSCEDRGMGFLQLHCFGRSHTRKTGCFLYNRGRN